MIKYYRYPDDNSYYKVDMKTKKSYNFDKADNTWDFCSEWTQESTDLCEEVRYEELFIECI